MHSIEKECLIDFFKTINKEFEYIVMRNAEELPFDNFSNDIDILIDEQRYLHFEQVMKSIFFRHGFTRVESTTFYGIECYTFYNIKTNKPYSLKIDLFFNIEGGGVNYYTFKDIVGYKIKNSNGISIFEPKVEAFLTVFKVFAAGGKLKDKYLNFFIKNNLEYDHALYTNCKSNTLKEYLYFVGKNKKNPNRISRKKIVIETFKKSFENSKTTPFKELFKHYSIECKRAFNKQYMIVLVGPDGSGKTTMINKLLDDSKIVLKSIPERISLFHHRPHLIPNISDLFQRELNKVEIEERTFNPHSGKASNQFISFFKLIYYSIDYRLGYFFKIIPLQRQNKFIVFDRYYFDFIVDQKRSALKISDRVALSIYKFIIPKPNKVFFIKTNATEAYSRKPELSINMIQQINSKYDYLTNKFKYFTIIPNENIEKSYNLFLKNLIITISKEIKL